MITITKQIQTFSGLPRHIQISCSLEIRTHVSRKITFS